MNYYQFYYLFYYGLDFGKTVNVGFLGKITSQFKNI